jgi:hypothetical protein
LRGVALPLAFDAMQPGTEQLRSTSTQDRAPPF